jgi:hypothetical protein
LEKILVKEKCAVPGTGLDELQDPPYALGIVPTLNRNESVVYLCNKGDKLEVRVHINENSKTEFKCPLLIDTQKNVKFGLHVTQESFDGGLFVDMKGGKPLMDKQTKGRVILMALGDDSIEYHYLCNNGKWYVMFLH